MAKKNILDALPPVRKARLLEQANNLVQSGEVSACLRKRFGTEMGETLFELIGIGQNHEDELDPEHVSE